MKYGKWEFDIWKWPKRKKKRFVIVGGGYVTRTFVEKGVANGILCIISKEAFAPYERPALTKRGERQTPDWYKEKGIEMLYEDPVTGIDAEKQTLTTNSLEFGSLIIATGYTASRFSEKIGDTLPGVHHIRDMADVDSLVSSLEKAQNVVVVGGGYIGMKVAAAAVGWNLDATVIFAEDHFLPRLLLLHWPRKMNNFTK